MFKDKPDVLTLNNKAIGLSDYLMCESVKPTHISYGTNEATDNQQLIHENDPTDMSWTLIHNNGIYYLICFMHDTKEVKFFANKGYSVDMADYTSERTFSANAIKVLGGVFYIASKISKELGWNKFIFQGQDTRLHQVYGKIVTNPYFLEEMKNQGFSYYKFMNNYYIFVQN